MAGGHAPGTLIAGRYGIERELARGGMGAVHIALDEKFGVKIALKLTSAAGSAHDDVKARFKREARIGNQLGREKGFVRAFDWGEVEGTQDLYLAMDLIEGAKPLDLKTGAVEERLARLATGAKLVAEAHRLGIVHRDLKPANFLQGRDGAIWLTDFGIAKERGDAPAGAGADGGGDPTGGLTQTGMGMGTAAFMAPEQFEDAKHVDARADVYALGVMLFYALTTRVPFEAPSNRGIMMKQLRAAEGKDPLPRPRALVPAVSEALDAVCVRAIALEAAARTPSADIFLRELAAALAPGQPATQPAVQPGTSGSAPTRPPAAQPGADPLPPRSGGRVGEGGSPAKPVDRPAPVEAARRSRAPKFVGALVALALVAGVGFAVAPESTRTDLARALGLGSKITPVGPTPTTPTPEPAPKTEPKLEPPKTEPKTEPPKTEPKPEPPKPAPPLTLSFTEPPEGKTKLLKEPVLDVKGKLSDAKAGPVRFGEPGKRALPAAVEEDGTFAFTLSLARDARGVEVTAGEGTRAVTKTIEVAVDLTPPEIADVTVPATWAGGPLEVSFRVKDEHPQAARIALDVDGARGRARDCPLDATGLARATFQVPAGARTLLVRLEAEDAVGHVTPLVREVAVDRTAPTITVEAPTAPLAPDVEAARVKITSTKALVSLRANGAEWIRGGAEAGPWSMDVPVAAGGEATLEVEGRDAAGNVGRAAKVSLAREAAPAPGPKLPRGLRLGSKARLPDGGEVQVYLWKLPGDAGDVELVQVPTGDFLYGDEKTKTPMDHAYWIGRNDVTWRQYLAFCDADGHEKPEAPSWGIKADHPVVNVSWDDAKAFCKWAGLGLPSEAEWEKAARGTDGRKYPWGDQEPTAERCVWDKHPTYGDKSTAPVGSCPAGASPYGALDMAGNVWQWCEDLYSAGGSVRVGRGGGWSSPAAICRSAFRGRNDPGRRYNSLGFRVRLRSGP